MAVNVDRLLLGVQALESGEFRQGTGALCTQGTGGPLYCCLGVLTEVALRNGVPMKVDRSHYSHTYDEKAGVLPEVVREWYGFDICDPVLRPVDGGAAEYATMLNDGREYRWDFKQIDRWDFKQIDRWDFKQIAAAFRHTFGLPPAEEPPLQEES